MISPDFSPDHSGVFGSGTSNAWCDDSRSGAIAGAPGGSARLLLAASLLLGLAGTAAAQNTAAAPGTPATGSTTAAPSDMPPGLQKLDDIPQPNLTTPKAPVPKGSSEDRPGTTDSRDNTGAVTETQVRTPVSKYTVRPNRQVGNAQPGDLQSSGNRGAQFRLGEFDLGRKKVPKLGDTPPSLDPVQGPPTMPTKN